MKSEKMNAIKRLGFTVVAILMVTSSAQGQVNFVLNPGFENYSDCPILSDQITKAYHWSAVDSSGPPGVCKPELCHMCSIYGNTAVPANARFYQMPYRDSAFAQVQVYFDEYIPPPQNYYRDYLQGRFHSPLSQGVTYCVSFYVNLANKSNYGINRIGAYIDDGSIDTSTTCGFPQAYIPQITYTGGVFTDTVNWVKVEGSYTAHGGERFITIGNFYDKVNTTATNIRPNCSDICHISWMLIDEVSVIQSNLDAFAGNDTTINEGDSVFLGRPSASQLHCRWYVGSMLIDSGAYISVQPSQTTSYILEQTLCGLTKYDTITVTVVPVGLNTVNATKFTSIYPNPATTELTVKMNRQLFSKAIIVNTLGQQLHSTSLTNTETKIDVRALPSGIYYIRLEGASGMDFRKFVKL